MRRLTRPPGEHPRGVVHRSEEEGSNVHPKESGLSRRQLLKRSAAAAAGLSAAGALAGCANTETPLALALSARGALARSENTPPRRAAADAAGEVSSAAAKLVVAKPLGPAG